MIEPMTTEFAPAERADAETILHQVGVLGHFGDAARVYNAVTDLVVILNRHRQIVFANRNLTAFLGAPGESAVLGLRPGEAIGCTHACRSPGGCGTTKFCVSCGAVSAILSSMAGREDVRECRILRDKECDALDLLVRATPLTVNGEAFTVCAIADISHEKRRRALERVFFHDVLNTAVGLRMIAQGFAKASDKDRAGSIELIRGAAERLVQEIEEQRDLMAAEASELAVRPLEFSVREFLVPLVEFHRQSSNVRDCAIRLECPGRDVAMCSDMRLLGRVLGNMIRNAAEACSPGQTITVSATLGERGVEFRVHNPGEIPVQVQRQLFQRSFSTKGAGRGLGTYSIKLLTEKYLDGEVSFTSSAEAGTVFRASYPIRLER